MRNLFHLFSIIILISSCGVTTKTYSEIIDKKLGTVENEKFIGVYHSKKGVMHDISCYGYNIGFLTLDNGSEIVICFDKLKNSSDLTIDCTNKISVSGVFEDIVIVNNGACASGTRKIFYATEWKCL